MSAFNSIEQSINVSPPGSIEPVRTHCKSVEFSENCFQFQYLIWVTDDKNHNIESVNP